MHSFYIMLSKSCSGAHLWTVWDNFGVFSKLVLLIFHQNFCLKSTFKYNFIKEN